MGSADGGTFSCAACGRKFKWKLAIAGKRLRCPCGEELNVPIAEEPGLVAVAVAPSRGRRIVAQPKTVAYGTSNRSKEEARFAFMNLTDPWRDLYVPVAIYLIGFMAALLWIGAESHAGTTGLIAMSLGAGALTLIKTAVLICLALLLAPPMGISFGLFWPAILKFAAIIILTDAALLWLDAGLKSIGGISASGRAPYQIIFVRLGLAAALISCCSYYLFNMDVDEVAIFAIPMAIVSWLIGFVLALILLPSFRASVTPTPWSPAKSPVPAVARVSPIPFPTSAPTGIFQLPPGQRSALVERTIAQRISKDGPDLHEGRQWEQTAMADASTGQLIEKLYAAGAVKVYVDVPAVHGSARMPRLFRIYVDQPSTDAGKAACQQAAIAYQRTSGPWPSSAGFSAGRFLIIDVIR